MSRASHAAAFIAGGLIATAVVARALPRDTARFKTLDAFAQALSMVQTNYVDPTDEQKLLYDAARGMLHNLDRHSTFLPPQRYAHLRQDTEGEFGGVGVTIAPGELDDARPGTPPYPSIDDIVQGSPAEVAGLQLDDRIVADGRRADRRGRPRAAECELLGDQAARRLRHARDGQHPARRLEGPAGRSCSCAPRSSSRP